MGETWKWINGFEGKYQISNLSRVKSFMRPVPRIVTPTPFTPPRGGPYFRIRLQVEQKPPYKRIRKMVHRLVLEAFVGRCPDNMEAGHLDGNPANNKLSNLKWVTKKENRAHRQFHALNKGKKWKNAG